MCSVRNLIIGFCFLFSFVFPAHAQSTSVVVDTIIISGNEKTHAHIIYRELYFKTGDTVTLNRLQGLMDSSVMNLLNTPLFLEVEINYTPLNPENISIHVSVKERWYIFPVFYISLADRNFNVWWFEQDHKLNRLEYDVGLVYYNMTGNNDVLRLNTVFGYSQKYEVSYSLPYFSSETNLGGGIGFLYQSNRQIYYTTEENSQVFFEGEDPVRKKLRATMRLHMRNEIHYTSALEVQYHDIQIEDTIATLNPDYLGENRTRLQFATAAIKFTDNHTDNRSYPLSGYYLQLVLNKIGLGFGDVNQLSVFMQGNIYKPLSKKFFLNGMLAVKANMAGNYPYYLLESLGYCEYFVRGYEYYVVDGQSTALARTNVKWKFIDWEVESPILKAEQFKKIPVQAYLKIFADAGYVADKYYNEMNPLTNKLLYSGGIGVDVTTYYDWVFRAEAAVNRLGEFGLYLHIGLDLNTYEACNIW